MGCREGKITDFVEWKQWRSIGLIMGLPNLRSKKVAFSYFWLIKLQGFYFSLLIKKKNVYVAICLKSIKGIHSPPLKNPRSKFFFKKKLYLNKSMDMKL